MSARPGDTGELTTRLADHAYLADRGLAHVLLLGIELARPVLLEGEPGVGKTEAARALAAALDAELVRLQCHEGLDRSQALYAWDHPRQLLHLRASEAAGEVPREASLYDERYLLARPLLSALRLGADAVLLIDEIDRADDEFEAFLLELLGEFQVTIPELGTVRAERPPVVVLTSNRTRELSDALRRRCLYHWIEHPDLDREVAIVRARAPDVDPAVARWVAELVARLRELELYKPPGVAETIDWARVLTRQGVVAGEPLVDAQLVIDTLGVVVKEHDDLVTVRGAIDGVLDGMSVR